MDEVEKTINKILESCPKEMSPPTMSAIIANIINLYNFSHLWPMVVAQTTAMLELHQCEEDATDAVEDADAFLDKITKGSMH